MTEKITNKQVDILTAAIAAFISGSAFVNYTGMSTTNILSLVVLILLYHLFRISNTVTDKKITIASIVFGGFYSACLFLYKMDVLIAKDDAASAIKWGFYYTLGFYLLFRSLTAVLLHRLLHTELCYHKPEERTFFMKLKFFFFCVYVMLVFWSPHFLQVYPGNMTTDSHDQLLQFVGHDPLSNHHPIAHTMMIKLFYDIGMALFDDQTKAIATYSICQAFLLASAFAYLLTTMFQFQVKRGVILTVLAYYALVPFHGSYSVTMWKDVPFGGIVIVLSVTIWRLFVRLRSGNRKIPVFDSVMLLLFGIAMCLFRSNGLYAYILLVPVLVLAFFKKSKLPAILAVVALPVAFLIKGPLYKSMGAIPPDTIESLSIPAQHIACVIKHNGPESLTEEQYELLSQVVDVEQIADTYATTISDPIKKLVRATDNQEYLEEHKMEFLKLWIDLGIHNPIAYLQAQIDQTYGFWYPDVQYWLYPGEFRTHGDGYSIERPQLLPEKIDEMLDDLKYCYKDIPYLGLIWSIGTASWVCLFMAGLCWIKRGKEWLIVYIPVLAILATLMIATPVFAEFRYAYSMFTTIPLLCIIPFCPLEKMIPSAVSIHDSNATITDNNTLTENSSNDSDTAALADNDAPSEDSSNDNDIE